MSFRMSDTLEQIKHDLAAHLDPSAIVAACRAAGHCWRQRLLDPVTTIHRFVLQVLHGNTALNHLRHFHPTPSPPPATARRAVACPWTCCSGCCAA